MSGSFGINCFFKKESSGGNSDQRDGSGKKGGGGKAKFGQEATDGGTKDKAKTKGGTNDTHAFGPVFGSGDVGNIGLGNADVATCGAVDDTGEEKKG